MKTPLIICLAILVLATISTSCPLWWLIVPIAGMVCFVTRGRVLTAFLAAFAGGAMAWGLTAWYQDQSYHHPVAGLLADMGLGSAVYAYLATAVAGGLLSGLAGALAASLRQLIASK